MSELSLLSIEELKANNFNNTNNFNDNNNFNNNDINNNNNTNANDIKKQTSRMKQKQNLESYLKEIGIEIEEEDEEEWQQVIDIFVTQKITPNLLKLTPIEDMKDTFKELKIAIGFQTQLLTKIKASKVCVEKKILVSFVLNFLYIFVILKNQQKQ